MDLPNDLNAFLLAIRNQLLMKFKDYIIGIYIYGSISYGEFEKFRSDVDVMVFLNTRLLDKDFEDLKKIYEVPQLRNSRWIKKLEMDYVFIGDIKPVKNIVNTVCFRNDKLINSKIEGFSMDLSNILDCGIVLYGPTPSTFIPEIEEKLIEEALLDKFNHLKGNAPKWSAIDFWNEMFIIIQLCRIIYSVKNKDKVVSKKKAAKWCSENVPDKFKSIIKTALKGIDNWEKPTDEEIKNKLTDFIEYAEKLFVNSKQ